MSGLYASSIHVRSRRLGFGVPLLMLRSGIRRSEAGWRCQRYLIHFLAGRRDEGSETESTPRQPRSADCSAFVMPKPSTLTRCTSDLLHATLHFTTGSPPGEKPSEVFPTITIILDEADAVAMLYSSHQCKSDVSRHRVKCCISQESPSVMGYEGPCISGARVHGWSHNGLDAVASHILHTP